jgi:3'(2'), 5'-bisphosphate nucleotidase
MSDPSGALLPALVTLAEKAGQVILEHYDGGTDVRLKDDASPVTAADEAAEAVILAGLEELTAEGLTSDWPVVAEEQVAQGVVPALDQRRFWLVDPLDGTREFLSRNGEFTVNIGLIEDEVPVLGVVHAPAQGRTWWGRAAAGAWLRDGAGERRIRVRARPAAGLIAIASRSHADPATDDVLARLGVAERVSAGSSLKFCLVAEGRADVYPRTGPTMEWDTAAGDAVLRAAGGRMQTLDGEPFRYRKPGFRNGGFIAWGGARETPG